MKKIIFTIVAVFSFLAQNTLAFETTVEKNPDINTINLKDSIIDVPSHLVIALYRAEDKDVFENKHWWNNIGIGAYISPEMLWKRAQYTKNIFSGGVFVEKHLSPYSSVQAAFNLGLPEYDSYYFGDGYRQKRIEAEIGYKWDLANFYRGFDLTRSWHWYLTFGLRGGITKADENITLNQIVMKLNDKVETTPVPGKHKYAGAYGGFHLRRYVSPHLAFFIEPRLALNTDWYDAGDNFENFDPQLSLLAGSVYQLTPQYYKIPTLNEDSSLGDNWFVQMYAGGMIGYKNNTHGLSSVKYGKGINFGAAVGHWLNPTLAYRLSLFESSHKYTGKANWANMRGGRVEFDINPIRLFTNKVALWRFGIEGLAGIETGYMDKHRKDDNIKRGYLGPTGAGQLKFYAGHHTAFFGESRLTLARYQYKGQHFNDKIFTGSVGVEVYDSFFDRYYSKFDNIRAIERLANHHWFIEAGGLFTHPVHMGENFTNFIDPGLSIAFGNRIDNYSAIRLRGNALYQRHAKEIGQKTRGQLNLSLDYMFNLTNAWMGIDDMRHVDLRLVAGPLLHAQGTPYLDNFDNLYYSFGGEFGAQLSSRLSANWELFAEPDYQIFADGPNQWTLNAGLTYVYDKENIYHREKSLPTNHWYVQSLGGAQLFALVGTDPQRIHSKWGFEFALGKDVSPLWGFKTSIFNEHIHLHRNTTSEFFGGRGELVLNLFRMFNPAWEESRFNWTASAGLEYGHLWNAYNTRTKKDVHYNYGYTAASQLQYRILDHTWLVASGRVEQLRLNGAYFPVSAHLGVQYDLNDEVQATKETKKPKYRWFVEGGYGYNNGLTKTVTASGGLYFTSLHGVRANATVGRTFIKGDNNRKNPLIEGSIDYLFNISNSIYGVDRYRGLDINLFAGVNLTGHGFRKIVNRKDLSQVSHIQWYPGFDFGAQALAHITPSISLFAEPRFNIIPFDHYLAPSYHDRVQFLTMAGLHLDFNPEYKGRTGYTENYKRNYWIISYRIQPSHLCKDILQDNKSGHGADITYGHWLNSVVALQAGAYAIKYHNKSKYRYNSVGIRPELALDVTSMLNPEWHGKQVAFVCSGGVDLGTTHYNNPQYMNNEKLKISPTAAAQLRIHVNKKFGIVTGIRATALDFERTYKYTNKAGETKYYNTGYYKYFGPVSFELGMMF